MAIIKNKIKKYFYVQASLQFGEDIRLLKLAYKAGVRIVLIGIESVELDSLKIYNKNLNASYVKKHSYLGLIKNIRKSGIIVIGCFILGCDNDTVRSFKKTLDFILESRIDILQITKPTPLPGTKFYNELYGQNRIIDMKYPDAWQYYTFTRMLFKPQWLEIEEVYQGMHYVKKNFYASQTKMKRFFRTLLDTKSITSAVIMLVLNSAYEKAFFNSDIYRDYDMRELEKKFNFKN
jgi:Fe-S oxidoreductase